MQYFHHDQNTMLFLLLEIEGTQLFELNVEEHGALL